MMSRYQRGAASNHFPVYHHCHSIFSWVAGLAPVLSPHTLGPGRDADRRKKTGWRRRIVIKEDLAAEERSLQGWVSSCAGPQSCSHWSLFSIMMSCVVWAPDLGRSTSLVTSHSLSLSLADDGRGLVMLRSSWSTIATRTSRLSSLTVSLLWLKKKDRYQRRPGCRRLLSNRWAPVLGPVAAPGELVHCLPGVRDNLHQEGPDQDRWECKDNSCAVEQPSTN